MTEKTKQLYLTVLVFPLWSLYLSFKEFRIPQAKNLFWLLCIFLGMIHIYSPEGGTSADGIRYAQRLIDLNQEPISWESFSSSFYDEEGGFLDLYQPTVTYFLSRVTDNPRWLFLIFAIVFGFFYSRNIWFVLDKLPNTITFPLFLLTLYYILICPIWEINGVRMWTALHVFVFGALPYIYNSDKSKLIWCFVSALIHFSFFFPIVILLSFHFVPRKINLLLAFYIISFFVTEIEIEQIRNFLTSNLPTFFHGRILAYTSEGYAERVIEANKRLNFYVVLGPRYARWAITILLVVACTWGKKIITTGKELFNLMCFTLFMFSIINIMTIIPTIGRFISLAQMFALASIIFFYISFKFNNYKQNEISIIFKLVPLMLILPMVVSLRMGCEYYGISLVFPFMALIIEDNKPIIQFIKQIF